MVRKELLNTCVQAWQIDNLKVVHFVEETNRPTKPTIGLGQTFEKWKEVERTLIIVPFTVKALDRYGITKFDFEPSDVALFRKILNARLQNMTAYTTARLVFHFVCTWIFLTQKPCE